MRALFAVVTFLGHAQDMSAVGGGQYGMHIPKPLDAPDPSRESNFKPLGTHVDVNALNFGKSETEGSLETMINRMEQQKANGNSEYFDNDLSVDEVEKLSEMVNVAKEREAEEEMKAEQDKENAAKTLQETNEIEGRQAEVLQSNNALGGLFNAAVHSYNQHVFTKNQLAAEGKKTGLLQAFLAGDESDFATAMAASSNVITEIGGLITQVADLADSTKEDTSTVNDLYEWDTDCTSNLNALVTQTLDLERRIGDLQTSLQVAMDQTTTMNQELAARIAQSKAPQVSNVEEKDEHILESAKEMAQNSLLQTKEKDQLIKNHPDYHSWSFAEKFQHLFKQLRVKSGSAVGHAEDVLQATELSAKTAVESLERRIKTYAKVTQAALASVPKEMLSPIQHA